MLWSDNLLDQGAYLPVKEEFSVEKFIQIYTDIFANDLFVKLLNVL